jgi:hypothetical protein
MDDNTSKLLEKLASKLGTTSEFLWNILVSQAKIDAITSLIQLLLFLSVPIITYRLHRWFSKPIKPDGYGGNNCMYDEYDACGPVAVFLCISSIISIIFGIMLIGDVINGFLNPQYWALHEILKTLKG